MKNIELHGGKKHKKHHSRKYKRTMKQKYKKTAEGYTCEKGKTLDECELEMLREAVDKAEEQLGKKMIMTPEIQQIVKIVEDFLKVKKLICYGGTAINNLLPISDQFYRKDIELPDYDFYSMDAVKHAKELADIYFKLGFEEVEAKAGQHYGTYKVYVNFIPIADITQLAPEIYKNIRKEAIRVAGIYYAPPNFLRMGMYLELSRPAGDVSRWEKVLKRLMLLNKNYPLKGKDCQSIKVQRSVNNPKLVAKQEVIYNTVRESFVDQGVIFFGGYANSLYMNYIPRNQDNKKTPDFDVLSEDPETTTLIVKERLMDEGLKHVSIRKHEEIGELVTKHYEINVDGETVAFVYEPLACHSYNTITIDGKMINVATIDTMLSFFIAFYYSNRPYYNKNRILCMAQQLFIILQKNRLRQKGLLKRFTIECYGNQPTIEDIRSLKAQKYEELKTNLKSDEYTRWFLKYTPKDGKGKKSKKKKTQKNKSKMLTKTVSIQGSKIGETIAIEKSALPKTLKESYGFTPKSTKKNVKTVRFTPKAQKKKANKTRKVRRKREKRGFLGISF